MFNLFYAIAQQQVFIAIIQFFNANTHLEAVYFSESFFDT